MPAYPWVTGDNWPREKPGNYLLWLSKERHGSPMVFAKVFKIANGYLQLVDGHWESYIIDDEYRILAWTLAPDGPTL